MLSCPACGRQYPSPTRFCAADGTPLVPAAALPAAPTPAAPASVVPWIVIGVLGLALIALAAFVLLRPQPAAAPAVAVAPAPPTVPVVPDPFPPQQQPQQQQPQQPPPQQQPSADLRVVSTPNDGFLSIRSQPDGGGTRLDRMLDGETVAVLNCGPRRVVDGDAGHWCRVRRQGGQTGWTYDAYLFPAD